MGEIINIYRLYLEKEEKRLLRSAGRRRDYNIVTFLLKAGIVNLVETAVARARLCKHSRF
jgi:hypothetical protein